MLHLWELDKTYSFGECIHGDDQRFNSWNNWIEARLDRCNSHYHEPIVNFSWISPDDNDNDDNDSDSDISDNSDNSDNSDDDESKGNILYLMFMSNGHNVEVYEIKVNVEDEAQIVTYIRNHLPKHMTLVL